MAGGMESLNLGFFQGGKDRSTRPSLLAWDDDGMMTHHPSCTNSTCHFFKLRRSVVRIDGDCVYDKSSMIGRLACYRSLPSISGNVCGMEGEESA